MRSGSLHQKHFQAAEFNDLVNIFNQFTKIQSTTSLFNANAWLSCALPESVTRTISTQPGWDADLLSPFVQKLLVDPDDQLGFIGDLHGSIHSLLRSLLRLKNLGYVSNEWKIVNPGFYLIFLGDLVDRGEYGVEVWLTVMKLYIENPRQV